ncbi:DUF2460 domain-containing protein [Jannaschia sp. LMIT008]|uniref:DUF2460 domain-containing protein n=1 Tax=Jannaschia maritima TaxID=3032585 RepID=UPI0028128B04|nr:DUF2460 domain-containing protein [Jannaschia sp. LMIT008]
MAFDDVRFPARISFGATGGPERMTEIVTLANGREERNTPWAHSRRRFDAGTGIRSLDDVAEVVAFFEARRGRLRAFRWKDWSDFQSCSPSGTIAATDQVLGHGDGARTAFLLSKTYGGGDHGYVRPIGKPVVGSVVVAVNGEPVAAGFEVDHGSGTVTFGAPPPSGTVVSAGFAFDVPVRFDTDALPVTAAGFAAGILPEIPVLEVRA